MWSTIVFVGPCPSRLSYATAVTDKLLADRQYSIDDVFRPLNLHAEQILPKITPTIDDNKENFAYQLLLLSNNLKIHHRIVY
jgi:hypothetical protein